jgi:hypothetical protein
MVFSSTIWPASEPTASPEVDADGLAPTVEALAIGLDEGLAEAFARAAGLEGATVGDGAALVAVAAAGVREAALVAAAAGVAAAGVAAAGEPAGADEAAGAEELGAGVAEWLLVVHAAVTRRGTATRAAIARTRCGRGGACTGVILADRPPV